MKSEKELPTITLDSTVFFSYRLAKAFPGQRGLKWYESKEAIKRLKILLEDPLRFKSESYDASGDPIWWFRGGSALFINRFRTLSKTKILIDIQELEVKKIAVNISDAYYKCYVYIETKGEKQTGLYNFQKEDIIRNINTVGYCSEEYGLLGKTMITRAQHDDGGTVIKGNVVDASSSELRERFLSDYNFIIAAKQSPYNSRRFDRDSRQYLNDIIQEKQTVEPFLEFLNSFEKYEGKIPGE